MKVLHIVGGNLSGGAARGAFWLHQAQRKIGIDSKLVTSAHSNHGDESVVALGVKKTSKIKFNILYRLANLPVLLYRRRNSQIFNTGFSGIDITNLEEYKCADIIHLHWINGLVAMQTLRKIRKPIVWTMRDMWPFTGGCHYSQNCDRYKVGCGECPQLGSKNLFDLTRLVVINKKLNMPKQVHVVGLSNWLTSCASESEIFKKFPTHTISNNINTGDFVPISKQVARSVLNIPKNKKIILMGAQNMADFYKGFGFFTDAMSQLRRNDVHILLFGNRVNYDMGSLGYSFTDLGFLNDIFSLRLAYSAADLFFAPYVMEAFGKTIAESLSCGTPVVCFDATGTRDIVRHRKSGYKAVAFDAQDLVDGINWLLDLPKAQYDEICDYSRGQAIELFESEVIAKKYLNLYIKIIK